MSTEVTYKTHILIGVRANGTMTTLAVWSHVPSQPIVLQQIRQAPDGYVTFALCTPTSILAGNEKSTEGKHTPWYARRR